MYKGFYVPQLFMDMVTRHAFKALACSFQLVLVLVDEVFPADREKA